MKGLDLAPYIAAEKEAMEKKRGMWVQGMEYVSPRDWRRAQKGERVLRWSFGIGNGIFI